MNSSYSAKYYYLFLWDKQDNFSWNYFFSHSLKTIDHIGIILSKAKWGWATAKHWPNEFETPYTTKHIKLFGLTNSSIQLLCMVFLRGLLRYVIRGIPNSMWIWKIIIFFFMCFTYNILFIKSYLGLQRLSGIDEKPQCFKNIVFRESIALGS